MHVGLMFFILKTLFGDLSDVKTTWVCNVMYYFISLSQTRSICTSTALQQTFLHQLSAYMLK